MLLFASLLLVSWLVLTFLVARRAGSFRQAVVAGMVICVGTLLMFGVANTIRVNVFLDEIKYRDDWRNLMARFRESGYTSLRAYVNRDHLTPLAGTIAIGSAVGAIVGACAGAFERVTRRSSVPAPR